MRGCGLVGSLTNQVQIIIGWFLKGFYDNILLNKGVFYCSSEILSKGWVWFSWSIGQSELYFFYSEYCIDFVNYIHFALKWACLVSFFFVALQTFAENL